MKAILLVLLLLYGVNTLELSTQHPLVTPNNASETFLVCPPAENFIQTHMAPDFETPQLVRRLDWFHDDSLIASYQQGKVNDMQMLASRIITSLALSHNFFQNQTVFKYLCIFKISRAYISVLCIITNKRYFRHLRILKSTKCLCRSQNLSQMLSSLIRPFYYLRIAPVQPEDSGTYRCRLETDPLFALTMSTAQVELTVMGECKHSSDQLRECDNVRKYQKKPVSFIYFPGTPSGRLSLCHLVPHSSYAIAIEVDNGFGPSPPARTIFITDETVPKWAPSNIRIVPSVGKASLTVHWNTPNISNEIITHYNLYYKYEKILAHSTTYSIRISASTSKGEGEGSKTQNATTDVAVPVPTEISNITFDCKDGVHLHWHSHHSERAHYHVEMKNRTRKLLFNTTINKVFFSIYSFNDSTNTCKNNNVLEFIIVFWSSTASLFGGYSSANSLHNLMFHCCLFTKGMLLKKKKEKCVYLEELNPLVYDLSRNENCKYRLQFEKYVFTSHIYYLNILLNEENIKFACLCFVVIRYLNIGAMEATRIRISSSAGSDYINANYIDTETLLLKKAGFFKEQYILCHEAIRQLIRHGITRVHSNLFHRYLHYLAEENVNGKTRIQMQYEDLCECKHNPRCVPPNDYIVLPGYHRQDEFIVSNWPTENEEFWQLVWQKNCQTVVLLVFIKERKMQHIFLISVSHGKCETETMLFLSIYIILQLCVRIVPVSRTAIEADFWGEIERIQKERLAYHDAPLLVINTGSWLMTPCTNQRMSSTIVHPSVLNETRNSTLSLSLAYNGSTGS
uniref:Tyrosine-protein phosphatase domain-containing protein n=1 Tax=Heterorhabditis bacteriophora TaxID=37862 RepID=A0A1I7WWS3_HETBA